MPENDDMNDREKAFCHELEVFRTEGESAIQFLYAYLAVHASLVDNDRAVRIVNETPLFWMTVAGALQTAFHIALGRVFDQNSSHNIDKLLGVAQDMAGLKPVHDSQVHRNENVFSKEALEARKRSGSGDTGKWVDDYMKRVYIPTAADFRRLRKYVSRHRKVYEARYRDIRHQVFAHKRLSKSGDVERLFARTDIREIQKLVVFLNRLHDCLWELFHNGRKPVLRPMKYSANAMMKAEPHMGESGHVQEQIVHEVGRFFRMVSSMPSAGTDRTCYRK